ncbi:hypothetical protein PRUPE_1G259100 [Prunus persica]|uniref:B-like cyclin n=1 Tax=Prunus persica TaxID=3760 RepID=A0A251R3E7_PRUPE|nr:hypothetical protein PRUPE_1G259100 [Prunus persica]
MSSVWSSDCFSDLLCCEDYSGILSGESPECSSDLESPACSEESIAGFIEDERNYVPGFDYLSRFNSDHSLDISARADSVAWILKQANGWPMQLLSVACLSLAAKMEEPLVPSLLDLQVEGTQFIFEPRTIRRMELLVLGVLDWRLRSITPFSFVAFFACKLDPAATFIGFLVSRATEIILSNIKEASFLEYWPSCIAAAAILSAANEIPNLSLENPEHAESWCGGLSKEKIIGCYRLMQEVVVENSGIKKSSPDVLPQLRVTVRGRVRSSSESSSSSVSLSSSSPMSYKRRKLNNCLWVDDDKGNSE